MVRPLHLAGALLLGACFTGGFLAGQPCKSDADCGPMLRCEQEVCGGGPPAQTTAPATSTDAPTTTGASATATSAPETTSTTGEPPSTSTEPVTSGPDPTTATTDAGTTGPGCGIGRCKDFDLLMVIDDSQSMSNKSSTLIAALIAFNEKLVPALKGACSIHFGVITTDKYDRNPPECQKLGALVRANSDGDACTFAEGLPYATLPDLDKPALLTCPVTVGSDGDGDEAPIDAILGAFQTDIDTGCNADFMRPESFLAVVLVTDEDDDDNDAQGHSGSDDLPESLWYGAITNLKGSVDDMYMIGLLGDENPDMTACPWLPDFGPDGFGAESAPLLRKFIQSFPDDHYAIDTLCKTADPSVYTGLMDEVLAELTAACDG